MTVDLEALYIQIAWQALITFCCRRAVGGCGQLAAATA